MSRDEARAAVAAAMESRSAEYEAHVHRMQSVVAMQLGQTVGHMIPSIVERELKHLHVGRNSAMAEIGMVQALLVEKGVVTPEEFVERLVQSAKDEAAQCVATFREENPGMERVSFA